MSLFFSGVNTGRDYEVGQSYKMGGDSYVAQADGSFVNQQTGRSFAGSSSPNSDQEVRWTYTGDSYSSGNPFDASTLEYVDAARKAATQAALTVARSPAAGVPAISRPVVPVSGSHGGSIARLLSVSARPQSYAGYGNSMNGSIQSLFQTPEWKKPFAETTKSPITGYQVIDAANGLPKILDEGVQYYNRTFIPGINFFWDMSQAPVDQGWEPFAGEPGEYAGGLNNIIAGIINSVPRNYEKALTGLYQGTYASDNVPNFLYVPGFPGATMAMPSDFREQYSRSAGGRIATSIGSAFQSLATDLVRGFPEYKGSRFGSAAQEPSDIGL